MSKQYINGQLMFDTDYSTSEVKTGATWIDGKPIYRKVVQTTTPSTSYTFISNWVVITNMEFVVHLAGWIDGQYPINTARPQSAEVINARTGCWVIQNPGALSCVIGASVAEKDAVIIVEYTKTTD